MKERLRSLVVLQEPPLKQGRAAGRLALAMAHGLTEHGVDVQMLAARQVFAIPGEPPDDIPVEVIDVPPETPGWRGRLGRLRRPVGQLARSAFGERVREAAREADVLHLEEIGTAWCNERVSTPSLIRLHYLIRWDQPLGPPWRNSSRHALEFELAERAAIRRYDVFAAASPRIAAEIRRRRSSAHVELVPFCLEPDDYPPAPLDGPPVAGLVGTAVWPPTRNAIEQLLSEVWPLVRRRVPEARLLLAGRGTEAFHGADAGDGVEVVGEVASSVDFLRGLSLLLYPLLRGSGVKVKVLESLAVGLPVVTTAAGAEGLEAGDGMVIETSPDRLAATAASILADPGERASRGAAARREFERRYTPVPATEPLAALYRRVAG
jgi:glycosyltransferase involved in cell wall biosynthesis